eukprot:6459173-Amphidinium_carterae.1
MGYLLHRTSEVFWHWPCPMAIEPFEHVLSDELQRFTRNLEHHPSNPGMEVSIVVSYDSGCRGVDGRGAPQGPS